ncbi:MAG: preprotein translocase subunit SecG [Bacteroidaceae bacterium]|nr:preprotein translocase subunit SecG [Bacteroidaceae bacterium]MBO4590783.1 preprotein translocase subunit SecG [Bacteroidaceae bacterium]MBR5962577.1 preprotein translocase subunit SecG [Bacteroidaceae bacterium]
MYLISVILIVIVSLLMCVVVLIQNSKGGGLASAFASSNQIMGVRKTTDFLEKATWVLAGCMVVLSIVAAYSLPHAASKESVLMEKAASESATNAATIPGFDAPAASETPAQAPAEVPAD